MAELRALAVLSRLCKQAGEGRGLTLLRFAAIPDTESDVAPVNRAQIIYVIEEAFGLPDELAALAASFATPSHDAAAAAAQREKTVAEAAAMARRLKDPNGGVL